MVFLILKKLAQILEFPATVAVTVLITLWLKKRHEKISTKRLKEVQEAKENLRVARRVLRRAKEVKKASGVAMEDSKLAKEILSLAKKVKTAEINFDRACYDYFDCSNHFDDEQDDEVMQDLLLEKNRSEKDRERTTKAFRLKIEEAKKRAEEAGLLADVAKTSEEDLEDWKKTWEKTRDTIWNGDECEKEEKKMLQLEKEAKEALEKAEEYEKILTEEWAKASKKVEEAEENFKKALRELEIANNLLSSTKIGDNLLTIKKIADNLVSTTKKDGN